MSDIRISDIERGLKIVVLYGETCLPIFNRLHDELEKMKAIQSKENLALLLVKKYADMK